MRACSTDRTAIRLLGAEDLLGGSVEGLVGVKKWRKCPWQISETVLFVLPSSIFCESEGTDQRFRDANATINK